MLSAFSPDTTRASPRRERSTASADSPGSSMSSAKPWGVSRRAAAGWPASGASMAKGEAPARRWGEAARHICSNQRPSSVCISLIGVRELRQKSVACSLARRAISWPFSAMSCPALSEVWAALATAPNDRCSASTPAFAVSATVSAPFLAAWAVLSAARRAAAAALSPASFALVCMSVASAMVLLRIFAAAPGRRRTTPHAVPTGGLRPCSALKNLSFQRHGS